MKLCRMDLQRRLLRRRRKIPLWKQRYAGEEILWGLEGGEICIGGVITIFQPNNAKIWEAWENYAVCMPYFKSLLKALWKSDGRLGRFFLLASLRGRSKFFCRMTSIEFEIQTSILNSTALVTDLLHGVKLNEFAGDEKIAWLWL